MVDSSVEGAGIIVTNASEEEIVEEASFAETRGWTATLDAADVELESLEGLMDRLEVSVPASVCKPIIRFLHLFSGPDREGDLGWWLRVLADLAGFRMIVENIDTGRDARWNLFKDDFFFPLMLVIRSGAFHGILLSSHRLPPAR